MFNNPVNLTDPTGKILPAILGAGCIAGAIGGVIGGLNGTLHGAVVANAVSKTQSSGGDGAGSSGDGCDDAASSEPPSSSNGPQPTTTPTSSPGAGDYLRNAAFDAFFGCLAGATAAVVLNPATVFTAAAVASEIGAIEGYVTGVFGQIRQLF